MEIIIIFFIIILVAQFIEHKAVAAKTINDAPVVTTKTCPPHKWRYQELKDTEGTTVRWRIVCDVCGPMKPSDGPARLE